MIYINFDKKIVVLPHWYNHKKYILGSVIATKCWCSQFIS